MAFSFVLLHRSASPFDSDVDIAVYFKPVERRLEWEREESILG